MVDQHSQSDGSTSEAMVFAELLTWSNDCPAWQRDALRRLCMQEKLEPTDHTSLLEICKGAVEAQPLTSAHIRDSSTSGGDVSLSALYALEHVNALAVGERLTFNKAGVTVIYGDNGAGKSGYARVLKQACRARSPKGETILPNIYAASSGVPAASIDFHVGGQKRESRWTQGSGAEALLSAVSIFDSRTANVHVENTNDLAYTPLPLKVLAALAQTCQDLKSKLSAEIAALESQTPAIITNPGCTASTPVGRLMAGLTAKTTVAQIDALAGLGVEQTDRLQALQADLGNDPGRAARHLLAMHATITAFVAKLNAQAEAVSPTAADALEQTAKSLVTARAAARAASIDLFAKEPLPDVGSDVWRALWDSARAFSEASVYPERQFPVTEDGARCVLCHQELDNEAKVRLGSFEAFIKDESKRQERDAAGAYARTRNAAIAVLISMSKVRAMVTLLRDELAQTTLAEAVRRAAVTDAWRLRGLLRKASHGETAQLPPATTLTLEPLHAVSDELAKRAATLQSETDSPERLALVTEMNGLADRKWLSIVREDVLAHIVRLQAIAVLVRATKDTATNRITTQSADIARQLVTNRLRGRFAREVEKLGVAGLAIELQQAKTNAGVPYFQVRLIDKPSEPVGKVLSEGEHRCVALAAFLAELATIDAKSAIVFDDPVSSLDHLHRDKVAARLAEEGRSRQVIVFTHDMAFLLLMEEACRATKDRTETLIAYRLISRGEEAVGFCHQDPPANVMPLDKVIEAMGNHLANVSVHHARGDQAKWSREVISFQDQIRTTWERAVEEAVCPVIKRLARKVDTTGLLKLTVLTAADCTAMREAFGRCSLLLHSQPGELNPALPAPSAIDREIKALASWIADIRQRQAAVA
ncbi:energy-coupling factor transporter ATP-binding protein EcfA2 [Sphingomonas sp. UYAg733]